jgi:hypothetical protein
LSNTSSHTISTQSIVKENVVESTVKLSDKYKGVFTKEDAHSMDNHVENMRGEWENI